MSFTKFTYHIVFATKGRARQIKADVDREVYAVLYNLCLDKGAFVWRIGGAEDHVHMLVDIPAYISISDFVKYVKSKSSAAFAQTHIMPMWNGWAEGYGGFSVSYDDVENVKTYILNQKVHHHKVSFQEEYAKWLIENGVSEDAPYFPKLNS